MVNFFQLYNLHGCSISEDIGFNKLCCCVSLLNGLFVQLVNVLLYIPVCFMLEQAQQLLSVLVTQVQIKELTKEGLFDRQGMATGEGGWLVTFHQQSESVGRTERSGEIKPQKPLPSYVLPQVRLCLLKFPQPPQTAPPAGDHML